MISRPDSTQKRDAFPAQTTAEDVHGPGPSDASGPAPAFPRGTELRLLLLSVATCFAVLAGIHYWAWCPDADLSFDAPYHVTMGDLFNQAATGRTFPWTQLSIWRTHFCDKELGFHALLSAIRRWGALCGYSDGGPPFVFETAVLVSLWTFVFCWVAVRSRVRKLHLFLPLVLLSCPFFTYRLNLVRPHVLSIMLMLATAACLTSPIPKGKRRLFLYLLGIAFAYGHSNPHFILIPVGCWTLIHLKSHRGEALLPCVIAVSGVLTGLIVHPQFPNTLIIWKLQCVDVVLQVLTGSLDLSSPVELRAPTLTHFGQNAAIFVMLAAACVGWWQRRPVCPANASLFLLVGLVCTAGFFLSKRMLEYAVPFTVIALGQLPPSLPGLTPNKRRVGLGIILLLMAGALPWHRHAFASGRAAPPRKFATWAADNLEPGTYICNLLWSDFPTLFYIAPEFRYAYGLDPMFAYAAMGDDYVLLEKYAKGDLPFPSPGELKVLVGTRYVYVSVYGVRVARRLAAAGYGLAYQGTDAWLFDLDTPLIDHGVQPNSEAPEDADLPPPQPGQLPGTETGKP
ncbi:MAG: hypothetical protein HN742_05140 [Lentisphaerae bacterium]|jgi:hypothetical protein|nr:hypothetical protein [Lentisphaerota bacterium]MBT4819599.1 hypothetical protein [Lentisphaerota bacterium]MBT5610797.1 hypothetical protein [Lentisphaerota bacterium]MBT7053771.1 hypothetical protein [Lentisphaerota bacterium]MBT7841232.1 hypothetical protein [Lentisphaerota bacterium]